MAQQEQQYMPFGLPFQDPNLFTDVAAIMGSNNSVMPLVGAASKYPHILNGGYVDYGTPWLRRMMDIANQIQTYPASSGQTVVSSEGRTARKKVPSGSTQKPAGTGNNGTQTTQSPGQTPAKPVQQRPAGTGTPGVTERGTPWYNTDEALGQALGAALMAAGAGALINQLPRHVPGPTVRPQFDAFFQRNPASPGEAIDLIRNADPSVRMGRMFPPPRIDPAAQAAAQVSQSIPTPVDVKNARLRMAMSNFPETLLPPDYRGIPRTLVDAVGASAVTPEAPLALPPGEPLRVPPQALPPGTSISTAATPGDYARQEFARSASSSDPIRPNETPAQIARRAGFNYTGPDVPGVVQSVPNTAKPAPPNVVNNLGITGSQGMLSRALSALGRAGNTLGAIAAPTGLFSEAADLATMQDQITALANQRSQIWSSLAPEQQAELQPVPTGDGRIIMPDGTIMDDPNWRIAAGNLFGMPSGMEFSRRAGGLIPFAPDL